MCVAPSLGDATSTTTELLSRNGHVRLRMNDHSQAPQSYSAGWYPSPNSPGYGEYWDGLKWTGVVRSDTRIELADSPLNPAPSRAMNKLRPGTWVGLVLGGLWVLVALASSGISGGLTAIGALALLTAMYVLVTGRASWARVPSRKIGAGLLAAALVTCLVGGAIAPDPTDTPETVLQLANQSGAEPSPTSSPSKTAAAPIVTTIEEVVTEAVPFERSTVDDPNLTAGVVQVTTVGVPGTRTITYRVTYRDGRESARTVVSDAITVVPITEMTSNGTYVAPPPVVVAPSNCNSNYAGACVPNASDVDCEGGSGNGPAYVRGPVTVVGSDVYDLDRDGDGIACD